VSDRPEAGQLTHEQRDRAESFGRAATLYDRFRPGYPAALVDDLLAARPRRVLDIGCGTGKAASSFAARGVPVLGVEIDAAMAGVAASHGLKVEIAAFEDWDDAGRRFDLLTCGQAWHWIDPAVGLPKAARLLSPGGELAVFWNFEELAAEEQEAVNEVYRQFAPEIGSAPGAGSDDEHLRRIRGSGLFSRVEAVTYPADRLWPVAEWVGNTGTQSNHLLLGERLPLLLDRLAAALDALGAGVRTTGGTYLIRARR
jgi:SAM-dependent methyltransferase